MNDEPAVASDYTPHPQRMRLLREDELVRLAAGWQLPHLSFGEQIRSMATELLGWRTEAEKRRVLDHYPRPNAADAVDGRTERLDSLARQVTNSKAGEVALRRRGVDE